MWPLPQVWLEGGGGMGVVGVSYCMIGKGGFGGWVLCWIVLGTVGHTLLLPLLCPNSLFPSLTPQPHPHPSQPPPQFPLSDTLSTHPTPLALSLTPLAYTALPPSSHPSNALSLTLLICRGTEQCLVGTPTTPPS